MSPDSLIPVPPLDLRTMIGPPELEFFENATGEPIFPTLPTDAYEAVFDFGCGCGRSARLLLQQKYSRPRRYVGIDIHRGMIDWCANHLSPIAPDFLFLHHDVWSPGYGRDNTVRLAAPFPVEDNAFSLVIANSVFTHIYKEQVEYYLFEVARIMTAGGVAMTTWFFFDNESFPFFRGGVPCLFTSETDPTSAVIYDRQWFLDAVRRSGLAVRHTQHPPAAGHQWLLQLEKRTSQSIDAFPIGENEAEWLCGATRKSIGAPRISQAEIAKRQVGPAAAHTGSQPRSERPQPPVLSGLAAAHAELADIKRSLADIKRSWSWKLAACLGALGRPIKRVLRRDLP